MQRGLEFENSRILLLEIKELHRTHATIAKYIDIRTIDELFKRLNVTNAGTIYKTATRIHNNAKKQLENQLGQNCLITSSLLLSVVSMFTILIGMYQETPQRSATFILMGFIVQVFSILIMILMLNPPR